MNTATLSLILIGSLIQMSQGIIMNFLLTYNNSVESDRISSIASTLDWTFQYLLIFLFLLSLIISIVNTASKNKESLFSKFLLTVISSALFFINLIWLHNFY